MDYYIVVDRSRKKGTRISLIVLEELVHCGELG